MATTGGHNARGHDPLRIGAIDFDLDQPGIDAPVSVSGDTITLRTEQGGERLPRASRHRRALLLVCVSPVLANAVGSVFNVLYNTTQTAPLLSAAQEARFNECWVVYNVVAYPLAVLLWALPFLRLRGPHRALLRGERLGDEALAAAQRRVVNLPWWGLGVAGPAWLLCVPVFTGALWALPEPLPGEVVLHLALSFVIAGAIAVTHGFFVVELVSQRVLYPVYFRGGNPAGVPGTRPLSVTGRWVVWAISGGVCPLLSLLLLLIVPHAQEDLPWFASSVVVVAILFNLATAGLMGELIAAPIAQLRRASARIAEGDLRVRVNLLRADEFGHLIERFNLMVEGLREREHLQATFGRHVGEEAAKQILASGGGRSGARQEITAMFVDIRNFTGHSEQHSPEEVVAALNVFFRDAVETVESHGGMVNKFLGDGFMALFGVGADVEGHAPRAVRAALEMLRRLDAAADELAAAGWPGLAIGVGVNTGPAVVGSIGSPKRLEYTAIGDTVNVAARVEALTKRVGRALVITESTHAELLSAGRLAGVRVEELPPQPVKGKGEPLRVFAITPTERSRLDAETPAAAPEDRDRPPREASPDQMS